MQGFTGPKIVEAIKAGKLNPKSISDHMRKIAVEWLAFDSNISRHEMAEVLMVHPSTITRDLQFIQEMNTKVEIPEPGDTRKAVKRLLFKANMLIGKALKKDNLELAWKIENDLVDKLGRMGFIKYDSELIKIHTGDVIESGGRKSTLKVDNGSGLTEDEQKQIDLLYARAKSRANSAEPSTLVP